MDEQTEKKLAANEKFSDAVGELVRVFGAARAIKMLRTAASMLAPEKAAE